MLKLRGRFLQIFVAFSENLNLTYEFEVELVSLGGHFACLCQGFDYHEVKNREILLLF